MKTILAAAALALSTVAAHAECHQVCTRYGNTWTCRQVCTGWPGTGDNDYRLNDWSVRPVQQAMLVASATKADSMLIRNDVHKAICSTHCDSNATAGLTTCMHKCF